MVGSQDVIAQLQEVLTAASRCASEETSLNYDRLSQDLADLETLAKGACAAHTDTRTLMHKLRGNTPLSADDLATLRLLIVGDADYFLKYDEEIARCKADTTKLIGEMEQLQASEPTAATMMHLGALADEARLLLELTRHYFVAKERVRRFESATGGTLDADARQALVAVVQDAAAARR